MGIQRHVEAGKHGMMLLVGIDAGASHTEGVAGRRADQVIARWRGGPGAVRPGEEQQVVRQLLAAVQGVLQVAKLSEPPARLVVGAAGAGREDVRASVERLLSSALGPATAVHVTTDGAIALEAAFGSAPGIVVTSGSGSIAYGRDTSGRVWRVGGHGWRTGDEGSGYALGRAALSACWQAIDGRGPTTALVERLCEAAACPSPNQLAQWAVAASTREVAALARAVAQEVDAGDPVAIALVERAVEDLARHVVALLPRIEDVTSVPVAFNGGLLGPESAVRRRLVESLRRSHRGLTLLEDEVDPARGALRLAATLA